ncbi:hypothetical protein NL676_008219 [Syzygium grande]|nr:hypothetical protein NL676_008219 [Syzygium grande]
MYLHLPLLLAAPPPKFATSPSGPAAAAAAASNGRSSRRDHGPEPGFFLRRSVRPSPTETTLRPSLATATPTPSRRFHSSGVTEGPPPPPPPPPSSSDPKRGVALYKPRSYEVLVADVAESLTFALEDGKTRFTIVRKLKEKRETRGCIVFPDKPEKRRATQLFKTHRFAPSRASCLLFRSSVPIVGGGSWCKGTGGIIPITETTKAQSPNIDRLRISNSLCSDVSKISGIFISVLISNMAGAGDIAAIKIKGTKTGWLPMGRNWGQNGHINADLKNQPLSFEVSSSDGLTVTSYNVAPKIWNFGQTFEGKQFES